MNKTAFAFVKAHEGCKLTAYQDGMGVWTIGWGATGKDVCKGLVWTQAAADARLERDLSAAESFLRRLLLTGHAPALSTEQMAALISFIFNIGEAAFAMSQLYQHVVKAEFIAATKEFIRWDHDNGKEVKGLLARRLDEAALFLRGS